MAQTLNKYAEQLNELENLQLEELKIVVKDVNQLLDKINKINTEIKSAMVAGYTPNELLDTRNMYLDKLSGYLNIYVENNDDGTVFEKTGDVYLIHGQTVNSIEVNPGYPVVLSDSNGNEFIVSNGQLFAHLQLLNGNGVYASGNESEVQGIQYYKTSLDMFAQRFAEVFNSLNEQNGTPKPLFVGDSFGIYRLYNQHIPRLAFRRDVYHRLNTGKPGSRRKRQHHPHDTGDGRRSCHFSRLYGFVH